LVKKLAVFRSDAHAERVNSRAGIKAKKYDAIV
jgi:hypothetical protein